MSRLFDRAVALAAALSILSFPAAGSAESSAKRGAITLRSILDHKHPRLVVVMVLDQFAYEYTVRFSDLFLPAIGGRGKPGGFRYLMEKGAVFADARFSTIPTFTGPGHSVIMTGAPLSESGIVSNSWLTSAGKTLNCVEDPDVQIVGAENAAVRPASPANFRASTVGDELRLATNGLARVIGIGIKDRGAILLSGHDPNGCVWFDSATGNWVTSTWYTTGTLPAFARRANRERLSERWAGKSWDRLLPTDRYARCSPAMPEAQGNAAGLGSGFPKQLSLPGMKADKAYFEKMTHTPFGNEMIFETGKHAIEEEQLGADSIPDILALSFSTPDFALHSYGPQSEEALDMAVRLDRQLAEFMTWLQESIPGGLESTLIILTADHGVAPVPELAHTRHKYPAQRVSGEIVDMATTRALASRFPGIAPDGISYGYREPYIYLDHVLLAERGIDAKQAREAIAAEVQALDGVCAAYTRDRIERGDLPPSRISDCVYHNYDPKRSGDITVVLEPSWLPGSGYKGTSHGSPYNYDTHVPLCFAGASIEPGLYTAPADVMDIAPTLSLLLGINSPNCARGRILGEMLR